MEGLARIGAPGMGSPEPIAGSTGAGRAAAARQPTSETATSAADREGVGGGGPPGRRTVASDGPDAGGGSGGGGGTVREGLARTGAPGMGSPEPTAGQTGDGTGTGADRGPDAGVAGGAGLAGCGFAEPDAFFELAESEADCFPRPAAKARQTIRGGFST